MLGGRKGRQRTKAADGAASIATGAVSYPRGAPISSAAACALSGLADERHLPHDDSDSDSDSSDSSGSGSGSDSSGSESDFFSPSHGNCRHNPSSNSLRKGSNSNGNNNSNSNNNNSNNYSNYNSNYNNNNSNSNSNSNFINSNNNNYRNINNNNNNNNNNSKDNSKGNNDGPGNASGNARREKRGKTGRKAKRGPLEIVTAGEVAVDPGLLLATLCSAPLGGSTTATGDSTTGDTTHQQQDSLKVDRAAALVLLRGLLGNDGGDWCGLGPMVASVARGRGGGWGADWGDAGVALARLSLASSRSRKAGGKGAASGVRGNGASPPNRPPSYHASSSSNSSSSSSNEASDASNAEVCACDCDGDGDGEDALVTVDAMGVETVATDGRVPVPPPGPVASGSRVPWVPSVLRDPVRSGEADIFSLRGGFSLGPMAKDTLGADEGKVREKADIDDTGAEVVDESTVKGTEEREDDEAGGKTGKRSKRGKRGGRRGKGKRGGANSNNNNNNNNGDENGSGSSTVRLPPPRVPASACIGFTPPMVRPRPPAFRPAASLLAPSGGWMWLGGTGLSMPIDASVGLSEAQSGAHDDDDTAREARDQLPPVAAALSHRASSAPIPPHHQSHGSSSSTVPSSSVPPSADPHDASAVSDAAASLASLASLRSRVSRCSRGMLSPVESSRLSRDISCRSGWVVERLGIGPDDIGGLVEHLPQLAVAAVARYAGTARGEEFLAALSAVRVSLNAMDVVNRLLSIVDPPRDFVPVFVANCIRACEEVGDRYLQHRLVRLLCVFAENLIRTKSSIVSGTLLVELERFCVTFSRVKEATDLFGLVKKATAARG